MLAVYPFVRSPCEDLELLLSVQSLRLISGVNNVVVVGDVPLCYDRLVELCHHRGWNLTMLRAGMTTTVPVRDVQNKLLQVTELVDTNELLLMQDDFLVIRPVDQVAHEHEGTLHDRVRRGGYWAHLAKKTIRLLGSGPSVNYDCHTPVVVDRMRLQGILQELRRDGADAILKSLYLNRFPPTVSVRGKNRKMRSSDTLDAATIDRYKQETWLVSLHHKVGLDQLKSYLATVEEPAWAASM